MKKIILCIFVGILSGCHNTHQISSGKSLDDYPNEGIVVGVITSADGFIDTILKYKGEESGNIRVKRIPLISDNKKKKAFALHLKEGKFFFDEFSFAVRTGLLMPVLLNKHGGDEFVFSNFELPFSVKKNEVIYIGNFNFNFKDIGTILFGGALRENGNLEIIDNFQEDSDYIKKEFPKLNLNKAKNKTIRKETTNSPIVIIK